MLEVNQQARERGGSELPLPALGLLLLEAGREAEAERFFLKEGRRQELVPQAPYPLPRPFQACT